MYRDQNSPGRVVETETGTVAAGGSDCGPITAGEGGREGKTEGGKTERQRERDRGKERRREREGGREGGKEIHPVGHQ